MMNANPSRTSLVLIALAASGIAGTQSVMANEYTVTDLGTLGGVSSGAAGLNNADQVVGASTLYSGAQHAFLWEDGAMADLGTPEGYLVSSASSVNDFAQAVGSTFGQYQSQYAYLWEDGVWSYLGTLPGPGLDYSAAVDINNAGQIVGYSFTLGPGGAHRAWIWEDGVMTDLGTLGGADCSANAINELGQVVGWAQTDDPDFVAHAFLWDNGEMNDLGTLPGDTGSSAVDINEVGQACGSSSHPVPPYFTTRSACLWDDGEILDLGVLPGYVKSSAGGMNDHGQVVGYLGTSLSGSAKAAFIWEDGTMTNLNTLIPPDSGWTLKSASEITESAQIIGWGTAPNGESHGFLLTPCLTTDFDCDGAVDLEDYVELEACMDGPGRMAGPDCGSPDVDGDNDVDLADFAGLQATFSGS